MSNDAVSDDNASPTRSSRIQQEVYHADLKVDSYIDDSAKDGVETDLWDASEWTLLLALWDRAKMTETATPSDNSLDLLWKVLLDSATPFESSHRILNDTELVGHLHDMWTYTMEAVAAGQNQQDNMGHLGSDTNCCSDGFRSSAASSMDHDAQTDQPTTPVHDDAPKLQCQSDASGTRKSVFIETAARLCGRRGDGAVLDALWMATTRHDTLRTETLGSVMYRFCQACRFPSDEATPPCPNRESPLEWTRLLAWPVPVGAALDMNAPPEWNTWIRRHVPRVACIISTVFYRLLLNSCITSIPSRQPYIRYPVRLRSNSAGATALDRYWDRFQPCLALMGLSSTSPDESCELRPLFQSDTDGFSIHTLCTALTTKFLGPTVLFLQTMDNEWLGYYTSVPWTTSTTNKQEEEEDSFLFRLYPSWNVYRRQPPQIPDPTQMESQSPWFKSAPKGGPVQYLHVPLHSNSSTGRSSDRLVGLVVDGTTSVQPRLHLTADLEQCLVTSQDCLFERGPLLSDTKDDMPCRRFDVACLEVWSVTPCGTNDNVYQQGCHRAQAIASVKERVRQQCAKVDRAQLLDDFQSGLYANRLFDHRTQTRGRADFCAMGDEQGYYIDGKGPTSKPKDDVS